LPSFRARRRPAPHNHLTIHARVSRIASVALRLGLLALATWALRRELAGVRAGALLQQVNVDGWRRAALALAGTVASFAVLGVIESLAFRQAETVPMPQRTAMMTAFAANALSQSIGLALLTGAAVRLRAYARRGVDAAAVARISGLVTLTVTLGLVACAAGAFLASPEPIRVASLALPVRPVGALLALVVLAYLGWSVVASSEHVGRGRWRLRRPTTRVALAQLALSSADWLITGTVLFAVMPSAAGVMYGPLLRAYLVAQALGVASHVPGGAGVFEAVLLTLVATGDAMQRTALIAALVLFRVVYYLLPLVGALIVAAVAELRPRRHHRLTAAAPAAQVAGVR
jgi:phosphatidylglycerol lysyltransferase